MRVISGIARGTILYTLEGLETRPTLDRVKEALFSSIQSKILDSYVLDLFSGSGALGIETISRGARQAILCDKSRKAIEIIKKNVEKTKFQEKIQIMNKDYEECLNNVNNKFDIIFIDPPYKNDIAVKAIKKVVELNLLEKEGIIILETDDEQRELKELENINISILCVKKYGRVKLIFLNQKGA